LILPTATIAGTDSNKPGWLGVNIRTVDDDLFVERNLNLDEPMGVLVLDVVTDSPADDAGLKTNDVILELNGQTVADADQLRELVAETSPGKSVKLKISRDGQLLNTEATLTERKNLDRFGWHNNRPFDRNIPGSNFDLQIEPVGYIGISMSSLTDQLGDYFGVDNGEGVLITEVLDDSPANQAGLKAGDVIVEINGDKISSVREVAAAIQGLAEGDKADIGLIRNRQRQSFAVTVEEREGPVFGSLSNPNLLDWPGNLQDLNLPQGFQWEDFRQWDDRKNDSSPNEVDQLRQELDELKQQFEVMRQQNNK
jgi:serine protease Do